MIWNDFGPSMFYLYIWMNGTRTRDILLELMNGVLCGGPGAARARGGSLPEPTDSPAITATTASPLTSPSRVRRPPPQRAAQKSSLQFILAPEFLQRCNSAYLSNEKAPPGRGIYRGRKFLGAASTTRDKFLGTGSVTSPCVPPYE
jgi:hypothetical protein